jgi:exoribonuclease R
MGVRKRKTLTRSISIHQMIPGILQLNSKTKYGMSSRKVPSYLFKPLDTSLSNCIVGSSAKDVTSNVLAIITVEHWETNKLTRGNLIRIIGKCGDISAEQEAILYRYAEPRRKKNKITINQPSFDSHRLVVGRTFNVDPLGCTDIDDAITIGEDGFIYIVIADVGCWMKENPLLFEEAANIGQTFYNDGKVVLPLLPIQEECSLILGKKRRGIALKFKWNGREITETSFEKVIVINNQTFTYESVCSSKYSMFLKELASHLAGKEITDSHEWIAQLMIFYNCEVAKELLLRNKGILRSQHAPDIEKLNQYAALGVDLTILANKSAFYCTTAERSVHWGLNKEYCHASSPIRRFADIVNQMVLMYDPVDADISKLNSLSTNAKKYERDVFFLTKVLTSSRRNTSGVVLTERRVWIPAWKRIITCENSAKPGTQGTVYYSVNMNQPTWKKRMVFRFEGIDCQE